MNPKQKASAVLYLMTFIMGGCGIAYEYTFSKISSDLLGNSVHQWAITIGMMMFFMGIGSDLQKHLPDKNLFDKFVLFEVLLGLIGGFGPVLLLFTFAYFRDHYVLVQYSLTISVGFLIGLESEKSGTIKEGARAMAAIWQSSIPWCSIIVRNVFGVAGAAHQNGSRFNTRYAWPSGRWGSLPLEGGIEAAYRADIDAADDPDAKLAEIEERLEKLRSPFRSAETFWIEEIIDPRDTRKLLEDFIETAAPLRETGPYLHAIRG